MSRYFQAHKRIPKQPPEKLKRDLPECKFCAGCGEKKNEGDRITCRKCRAKSKPRSKQRYEQQRQRVFEHYGKACACCGEDRAPFLAIDHMKGAPRGEDQKHLTDWIVKNGFPKEFRILCHNCNMAVRFGRVCPHQAEKFDK